MLISEIMYDSRVAFPIEIPVANEIPHAPRLTQLLRSKGDLEVKKIAYREGTGSKIGTWEYEFEISVNGEKVGKYYVNLLRLAVLPEAYSSYARSFSGNINGSRQILVFRSRELSDVGFRTDKSEEIPFP